MTDSDLEYFSSLLTGIADYYRATLSPFTMDLYWRGLRRFDMGAVELAIQRHIARPDKDGGFMPKVNDLTIMLMGSSGDQSAVAWAKLDRAVRTVGTGVDVVFDDALIHRVVEEMGGWVWFGTKDDKEWPFIARDFQARYQGYRMRGEAPAYRPVLTGIYNSHNGLGGMALQPPVLIGRAEVCKAVAGLDNLTPMCAITRAANLAISKAKRIEHT